ncbi:MAG TPA: sulfatase-like hydrolase/transferase [Pseudomonas sp.]
MSDRKNIQPLRQRAVLSLCTASTVFLWVPLYVVYLSINDINFNLFDFFASSLLVTLAASLVLFAGASLLSSLRLNWLGSFALYFILFWCGLAGYMLPLVQQAGMVSPEDLATNSQNLALVASASLALALLTFTRLKSATQIFLAILTVTTLGSALPSLFSSNASLDRFSALSTQDNVLVLSFDGLAGSAAKQVLEEDPELKEQLKDFIFFDNAVSTAPATWTSIRSELYGNFNFREIKGDNGKPMLIPKNLTNSLQRERAAGADVVTYGAYSVFNEEKADQVTPLALGGGTFSERASTALDLYPYVAARVGTAVVAGITIEQINTLLSMGAVTPKSRRVLEHRGVDWDALNTLQNDDLLTFIDNLHLANGQRRVRYLHLLHTHFPVDLDENCTYRSADKKWFDDNQNNQGILNETHCALRQTARLIGKLKELGIYDKSLLVVKSDHGVPVSYMDHSPDNYMVNNHPTWGYNRYRPLLMIKTRSHQSETLTYNGMLASLSDLAKTLCLQTSGKQFCEAFSGVDILENSVPGLFIDFVKNERSGFTPDTHITVEVPRLTNFQAALRSTGKVNLATPMDAQRKSDLERINAALAAYYKVHRSYPVSQSFDGLHSKWGKDTAQWISGLAPKFIPSLPLDPANSDASIPQYIYLSDGKDYKVLAHGDPQSCVYARSVNPELVDPVRNCWAFGHWTEGARAW